MNPGGPEAPGWNDALPDWYVKRHGRQPCVNIGTAGHVDHGKTTLIQALTGRWTSVHSQELRRGITIRVGYTDAAFYRCASCEPPLGASTSPKCPECGAEAELSRVVSFVDSPGHESLMANMLSGAALMDGSLLVVAANQKVPQLQTEEHLLALDILGITQVVVVQNKVDLLTYEQAMANHGAIASFLKGAGRGSAPVIPVSAQSSLNTDALIDSIERTIPTPERDPSERPIMHVLRSFDVNRPGTEIAGIAGGVIGGSLTQGSLRVGDEVEIRPGVLDERRGVHEPLTTTVTSLGTGAGRVDEVRPGGLVAIGTRLDPAMTAGDSLTGSVIGSPGSLPENATSATMDVSLFDSAVGEAGTKIAPVKEGEMLRLSVGTAPALCQAKSAKGGKVTVEFRRSVCLLGGRSVAISRKIADRWRLIGAGKVG
ncbi:MAG: translation initiation factor IF-2 subunit gamma [Thaumarchaeota archaeon]|nr:translation initiation factor IF-2 subunit gamma [Nitrososphaerota archaeon]RNJ72707.1 MAG: translation initiation factor IF-2 subunit gamma [Thaumarchaeota archaeon S15]RNJ72866.1 MAG: translation initiation factor IF-2 subunit gamma [Thaumarchaeota archaeon S13]RNJ73438.1 MAG: translation initiation factor IF-2 subunit gamma [Thaumarchaeota archaeon S14]MDD9825578.1 translation initiation factor IF-2 subunit gamma [Nitrososphaerota archaeon]